MAFAPGLAALSLSARSAGFTGSHLSSAGARAARSKIAHAAKSERINRDARTGTREERRGHLRAVAIGLWRRAHRTVFTNRHVTPKLLAPKRNVNSPREFQGTVLSRFYVANDECREKSV